jgi:shikimate kinase
VDPAADRLNRIYLAGFMGCGKSTIGPILANTLGYAFADVDRAIEERTGRTIPEIFQTDGELPFRALEREIIDSVATRPRIVVALGGGTLTVDETRARIRSSGLLVYLCLSPAELTRRLVWRTDRPLLLDERGERLPDHELRARVARLFAEREPLYREADVTVAIDEQKVGLTVDRLVKRLAPLLR